MAEREQTRLRQAKSGPAFPQNFTAVMAATADVVERRSRALEKGFMGGCDLRQARSRRASSRLHCA
jgi:hypothetical protein